MPLHLLGKKSWNVYNQDNIERVRCDEADAQARALEQERVGQDAESDRRLSILRGGDTGVDRSAQREEHDETHRKRRRLAEDHKTDKDSGLSRPSGKRSSDKAPLFDHTGHIDLVSGHVRAAEGGRRSTRAEPKAESEGVRLADAAGYGMNTQNPWYSSMLADGSYRQDGVSKDVWGNEDPRRHDREKQRTDASDPLAAMKRGVRQLRTAEADRKEWKAQRERDLNEVEELAKQERKHRKKNVKRSQAEGIVGIITTVVTASDENEAGTGVDREVPDADVSEGAGRLYPSGLASRSCLRSNADVEHQLFFVCCASNSISTFLTSCIRAMSSSSPQRPGPLPKSGSSRHHHGNDHHQHSKSWTARLYRKHDAKHHQREAAPLLADENPEEPEPSEGESEPEERQRCRSCCSCCSRASKGPSGLLKKAGKHVKDALVKVGEAAKSAGNAVAGAAKKSGSKARDNPKKIMGVTIAVLLAAVVGLGIALVVDKIQHKKEVKVCTSAACVQASDFILRNLDPDLTSEDSTQALDYHTVSLDPCTNFDEFVCGGFDKQYDLREDQGDMYTGSIVADHVESQLKRIVMQDGSKLPDEDVPIHKMLKRAFSACMDASQAREAGLKPVEALVDQIKELMPTSKRGRDGARRVKQSTITLRHVEGIDEALAFLKQLDTDALIKLDVIPDPKEPDQQIVAVSPVLAIGLPAPEYYRDAALVKEYRDVATKTLSIFYEVHVNSTSILQRHQNIHSSVLNLAQGVIDLEVKLALALPFPQELTDIEKTYNKVSIGKLAKVLPQVSVEDIIRELAPGFHPDSVLAASPKYLERLSFVLAGTPVEIVQAYLAWKIIQKVAEEVEDPKLDLLKQFQAKLRGASQQQPAEPWRQCVREVNGILGWIMSHFFVKEALTDPKALVARVIAEEVKKSFTSLLKDADWMTEKDRKHAVEKALAVVQKVGFPDKHPDVSDHSSLEKYYRKLNITDSHFANKLEFSKFDAGRIWSKLSKPTDNDEWHLYSTDVNAYYDHFANELVLPAALIQPPLFFEGSMPEYLSYGSLGSIAGHEVAHAFSTVGSLIDKNGKLGDWWSKKTRTTFDSKAQCFAEQYSEFKVKGPNKEHSVNGNFTLAENIADAVGVRAAYLAWKEAEKKQPSKTLPGLEKFTNDQLFWIAYGNRWCSKTTAEKAAQRILVDTHAPKPARILGTVANSEAFLKAFDCPSKEPTCEMF